MEDEEIDRDLQRKRLLKVPNRIYIEYGDIRNVVETERYRDLMETKIPEITIIKKRVLVRE